jgi:hypothetical protein
MARNDPSLLALQRVLRLIGDLDEPERAYLIARLQMPRTEPATAPVAPPKATPAAAALPAEPVTDEPPPKGFDLVDEVDGTTRRVGGKR